MRYIYIILLCLFFTNACSNNDEIVIEKQGAPALWKVSAKIDSHIDDENNTDDIQHDNNQTDIGKKANIEFYLFGTVHLLPEGAQWQSEALSQAITQSDILITETIGLEDTANVSKIFTTMSRDEPVNDIDKRVRPSQRNLLKNIIKEQGLSQQALNNMETWAAALAISNAITSDLGYKRTFGVETILKDIFDEAEKPNEGLESIASQFAVFDDLNENHQRAMLESIIDNGENSKDSLLNIVDAWLDGDSDALLQETNTGIMTSLTMREALLDNRNRKWVIKLQEKSKNIDDIVYFVAVGAAHLVGKNSVPNLLQNAGYKVERIQ